MKLQDVVCPECILVHAPGDTKDAMLTAIAHQAKASPILENVPEDLILEGLRQRETLGSTGFGKGIAIPHCRLDQVPDFVVGFVTSASGVPFDAMDGQPVYVCAFIIAPSGSSDAHIHLLSTLSRVLNVPSTVEELRAAESPEALRETFLRHAQPQEHQAAAGKSLFQVFVQDEGLFREILEIFVSLDANAVAVVEAENTGKYLSVIPLFAGLWADDARQFMHIILAVADRRLTNETIRRIEDVTGPLAQRQDIIVAVQELLYCGGSLGV